MEFCQSEKVGTHECCEAMAGFPLRLENLEKWEGIFQSGESQGILNRLEKSGKITQNTGKTSGNFSKMLCYLLVIFKNELCIIC